jgi:Dihydroxyacid dehydratase/phosphogluconate dehydratase
MDHPMPARRKTASELRSARWFAPDDLRAFGHRSRFMQMGYGPEDWVGRPVVAIINTWSDINPCHAHFKHRVEDIKHGILQAGGLPLELPALSLSESYVKPTTMLYRNMLAMDVEELLRCHPVDGAVLMGGCDKTTPALLMGATSAGFPASSCRPARCCGAIGRARSWAPAPMPGNIGTSGGRARSPIRTGSISKPASRAATAIA